MMNGQTPRRRPDYGREIRFEEAAERVEPAALPKLLSRLRSAERVFWEIDGATWEWRRM